MKTNQLEPICSGRRVANLWCRWGGLAILPLAGGLLLSPLTAGIPEPDLVWYGKVLTVVGGSTVRATTGTLVWRLEPLAGGTPWTLTTQLANINDQFSFVMRVPCESPESGVAATDGTVVLTTPAAIYRRLTVSLDGAPLTLSAAPTTFAPVGGDRGLAERIDLTSGTGPIDSDGDGISDAWEELYFGAAGAQPNDDPDGDGKSNLREFRSGTNPKDAQSLFDVVEVKSVLGGLRLRWSSVAGKTYRVRRSPTLLAPPADYSILQSNLAATPPFNEMTDSAIAGGAQYFYLVEIQ